MPIKHGTIFIVREAVVLLLAIIATYIISAYIAPWYVGSSMSSGVGQTGWPVAYWMKTWVEHASGGVEESSFDFFSFVGNVGLFYLAIRLVLLVFVRKWVR